MWWDFRGIIRYELLLPGRTLTAAYYQNQLMNLYDQLEQKGPFTGQETRHVILQHDNAPIPPVARGTRDTIHALG